MPVIRRLLVDDATDAGLLVAVSDAAGRLLWVEGEHRLRTRAEAMHFVAGADWSEAEAGTNAPGTALALGHAGADLRRRAPVAAGRRRGAARPRRSTTPTPGPSSACSTSPAATRSPRRRRLTLVRATVAAVEAELRLQPAGWARPALAARAGTRPPPSSRLERARPARGPCCTTRPGRPGSACGTARCCCCWPSAPDGLSGRASWRSRCTSTSSPRSPSAPSCPGCDRCSAPIALRLPARTGWPARLTTDADAVRRCLAAGGCTAARRPLPRPAAAGLQAPRRSSSCGDDLHSDSAVGAAGRAATRTRCCASPTPSTAGDDFELWRGALAVAAAGLAASRRRSRAHVERLGRRARLGRRLGSARRHDCLQRSLQRRPT